MKSSRFVTELAGELAAMRVTDEQVLLEFIPLASRLASLGDRTALDKVAAMSAVLCKNFAQLLIERAKEGMWDLEQMLGVELAGAIVEAQDFYCFLRLARDLIPSEARRKLLKWANRAEEVSIDERIVTMLDRFRRRFPIPRKHRLAIVHAPISEFTQNLLIACTPPRPVIHASWGPPQN